MTTVTKNGIDLLLYSHDGRGQGHVSRNVAIGLAAKRLNPKLRVLLATGCRHTSQLIGGADLDWIKLPAYRSEMVDGRSQRRAGPSNLNHPALVRYRAELLEFVVKRFNPRCLLIDHLPMGKDNELAPTIEAAAERGTKLILGLRAIPGEALERLPNLVRQAVANLFSCVLWYGDLGLHGSKIPRRIEDLFGLPPFETGLVSRASELSRVGLVPSNEEQLAGVVALSWCGTESLTTLATIVQAVSKRSDGLKEWRIFSTPAGTLSPRDLRSAVPQAAAAKKLREFSCEFLGALEASKVIITFSGYNSISDIIWARKAALLVTRNSTESEQAEQAESIRAHLAPAVETLSEAELTVDKVAIALENLKRTKAPMPRRDLLRGSELAARRVHSIVES